MKLLSKAFSIDKEDFRKFIVKQANFQIKSKFIILTSNLKLINCFVYKNNIKKILLAFKLFENGQNIYLSLNQRGLKMEILVAFQTIRFIALAANQKQIENCD